MRAGSHVLVTGAAGFIGRQLVETLLEAGREVVSIDHRWSSIEEVRDVIADRDIDWCAHLGWYADPRDYLVSVAENVRSIEQSVELVELLGKLGCRRLVVAGSCAEYANSGDALDEAAPIGPWSVYGAAKASLYLLLQSSLRPPSLAVAWARFFNISGPGEHPDRLLPWVFRSLLAGRRVELTHGRQERDYLDVSDVARAVVDLGCASETGVFNVCSGVGITVRDLIERLARHVEGVGLLDFGARPYGEHDAMSTVGVNRRLAEATGWSPVHDVDEMIDRVATYWTMKERGLGDV